MGKLEREFYTREDVVEVAKDLIGKYLFTQINGLLSAGRIVETEAYNGRTDRACHAHLNRRTKRTEIMYAEGGLAYVYLVYGLHNLFNIVTNKEGYADAVLVRAIEPVTGIELMQERRNLFSLKPQLTAGPGITSQALGITKKHYGTDLTQNTIWLEDRGKLAAKEEIIARPRVGVAYAQEDALLPWRFSIKGNRWVSKAITNYSNLQ